MMNYLLAAQLLVSVLLLAVAIVLVASLHRVAGQIRGFVTPQSPDKPSPLAETAALFSDMLARTIAMQAKTFLMGKSSAASRAESAVEGDIAEDLLSASSPIVGALLKQFPKLAKTIRRNPDLAGMALEKLLPMLNMQAGPAGPGPKNGGVGNTKISL